MFSDFHLILKSPICQTLSDKWCWSHKVTRGCVIIKIRYHSVILMTRQNDRHFLFDTASCFVSYKR